MRRVRPLLAGAMLVSGLSCNWNWPTTGPYREPLPEPSGPKNIAASLSKIEPQVDDPQRTPWLREHWATPVPLQGPPPPSWTNVEQSIHPGECAICHPSQAADWKDSRHARAMGPGVMGQLIDDPNDFRKLHACQRCHAPLSEQYPSLESGENPAFDPELRAHGLSCAACHVRSHERRGPPTDHPVASDGPHGGFVPRSEFESPAFCATCHDFRPDQKSLNGKLMQETTQEWRRTRFAAQGKTCQGCHMPDRRHLFRGIHDKDTVLSGIEISAQAAKGPAVGEAVTAHVSVTNVGVGHRLPTYSPPQITLILEQVDASGSSLSHTQRVGAISRRLSVDLRKEVFDNRLLPGESYRLDYDIARDPAASAVRARIEVWPDEGYRRFYEALLKKGSHGRGSELIEQALAESLESRYPLWSVTLPLN